MRIQHFDSLIEHSFSLFINSHTKYKFTDHRSLYCITRHIVYNWKTSSQGRGLADRYRSTASCVRQVLTPHHPVRLLLLILLLQVAADGEVVVAKPFNAERPLVEPPIALHHHPSARQPRVERSLVIN